MSLYYEDEHVTLYLGDCLTEHREWLEADVLVTDPPYGMAYDSNRVKGRDFQVIANDQDTTARDDVLQAWGNLPALTFGTWKAPRPTGTRQVIIWDKSEGNGTGSSLWSPWGMSHEEIYLSGEWPPIAPGGRLREGGKPARSAGVLRVPNYNTQSSDRPDHPTPKPVSLMERLIEKCPPGVIADPFAGSGSTLVAARNLGRRAIGVELEEKYAEIIAKRLQQGAFDFGGITA